MTIINNKQKNNVTNSITANNVEHIYPQKKGMECDLAMGSGKNLEVLWCLPEDYILCYLGTM